MHLRVVPQAFALVRALRDLVGTRVDSSTARAVIAARRASRAADFLATMRRGIYGNPGSPYERLLRAVGCEHGDLEALVARNGVEGALEHLYRMGVYLRGDELKGRVPLVRGSTRLDINPEALINPCRGPGVRMETSGGTGTPARIGVNVTALRDALVNYRVSYDSDRAGDCEFGVWGAPGSATTMAAAVLAAVYERPPVRAFAIFDPRKRSLPVDMRGGDIAMRLALRTCGLRVPRPEYASPDDPQPILAWLRSLLVAGETPFLTAYPTAALRLGVAAERDGIDLAGCRINVRGEPLTTARRSALEAAGIRVSTLYGTTECDMIAYSCSVNDHADECHLFDDLHAVVRVASDDAASGLPSGALLMSSIRPTSRLILLNASMGDFASLSNRECDCPLGRLGFGTRLHTIRSFEKLTGAGMTFDDAALTHVLEDILPARFGGNPADHQVVEHLTDDGRASIRLVVAPTVGSVDLGQVREAFLSEIGASSSVTRMMSLVWSEQNLLEVERRAPYSTTAGTILHVHRPATTPAARQSKVGAQGGEWSHPREATGSGRR